MEGDSVVVNLIDFTVVVQEIVDAEMEYGAEFLLENHFSMLKSKLKEAGNKRERWVRAALIDINGDYRRFITDYHHPNYGILLSHPMAFKFHTQEQKEQYQCIFEENCPAHPEVGVVFKGAYRDVCALKPPIKFFNPTGFTLLLRVFKEKGDNCVLTFGYGYRWFGITRTHITLNNQSTVFPLPSALNEGQWNDVWISYNNAQSPKSYVFTHENPNTTREILCVVNGSEGYFDIPVDIDVLNRRDHSYIENEMKMHFVNYSCGACFSGLMSSIVLMNQSCTNMAELQYVASTFLKRHTKPTLTYQKAKEEAKLSSCLLM